MASFIPGEIVMRRKIVTFILAGLLSSSDAFADAEDVVWLMKQLDQMNETYKKLDDTYEKAKGTYDEIKSMNERVHSDLNGHFKVGEGGIGDIYNDITRGVNTWNWTAETWEKELQTLSGGNPERYKQLTEQYDRYYPTKTVESYQQGATQDATSVYSRGMAINKAVIVDTTQQFDDIEKHLKEVNELSKQINNATTTKEAMDLNSKILSETAYIQLSMLRMQTLVNQQVGHAQAAQLVANKEMSDFNTIHLTTE